MLHTENMTVNSWPGPESSSCTGVDCFGVAEQLNFLAVIRSNPFQSYGYSLLERLFNVQEGSEPTKIEAALAR